MDPFSHLLLGYLLGFGVWGPGQLQFVVAAAIAGALPDADVALFPLSGRFPLLRHRGISHSILGVTVIAVVGCVTVPRAMAWGLGPGFAVGSPFVFFGAMEIGGLSHVFLDSLDHWSVPVFAPFSRVEYHFDVDRIVNVGSMAFTVAAYGIMLYERGRVPVTIWADTTWVLLAAVVAYFVIRVAARWRAGIVQRQGGFTAAIPQGNPLEFVFFEEQRGEDSLRLRQARYHLLRGFRGPPRVIEFPRSETRALPVDDEREALARSYAAALEASWMLGETHPFAEVRTLPGRFVVFWYSLEVTFWGRAAGVTVTVDKESGKVSVKKGWKIPEFALRISA